MITEDGIEVIRLGDYKPVRARKARVCSHCLGKIQAGTTYFRQAWKVEGSIQVTTSHDPHGACSFEESM